MESTIVTVANQSVTNPLVKNYAETFCGFMTKTAENYLEMGRVVMEADKNLNKNDFKAFLFMVGVDKNSTTLRKLKSIGVKYDLLKANLNSLPSAWTTLYEISRLGNEKIEENIEKGLIHPRVEGVDVKVMIDPHYIEKQAQKPKAKSVPNGTTGPEDTTKYGFEVVLTDLPNFETMNMVRKILKECRSIKAELALTASLEEFLKDDSTVEAV